MKMKYLSLESKNLIKGQYYTTEFCYDSLGRRMIYIFDSIRDKEDRVNVSAFISNANAGNKLSHLLEQDDFEFKHGEGYYISNEDRSIREATHEERKWLDTCIRANKFIPIDEIEVNKINDNYSIY